MTKTIKLTEEDVKNFEREDSSNTDSLEDVQDFNESYLIDKESELIVKNDKDILNFYNIFFIL